MSRALTRPIRRFALGSAFAAATLAAAAAEPEVALIIKDHSFRPAEIKVPAGQRVRLVVHNQDATPEEFESRDLKREKLVPPGAKVLLYVGPLKPGRYAFVGEYHEASARGVLIAE